MCLARAEATVRGLSRREVLTALQAESVSHDLQDAVARAMASHGEIPRSALLSLLRAAGVPDRLAVLVEEQLVSWAQCRLAVVLDHLSPATVT